MTYQVQPWRRPVLRILMLAAAVAAAPLPCLAGEATTTPAPGPGLKASIEKAVASEALAGQPPAARAQETDATKTDLGSSSFFKSKAGIVTLAVIGVGLGYALYSTQNDAVKSPKVSYEGGLR